MDSPKKLSNSEHTGHTLFEPDAGAIYDFIENSENGENKPESNPKLNRSKMELVIKVTPEEKAYRLSEKIDITSDEFMESLKCTSAKCQGSKKTLKHKNRAKLKNIILRGKKVNSLMHPVLGVLFCRKCNEYYCNGEFSMDEDNEDKYCRWCGEGGTLFICSRCVYGFCPECIKTHFGKSMAKEIRKNDNWLCFFCNPRPLWKLRAIAAAAKAYARDKRAENLKARNILNSSDSTFESDSSGYLKKVGNCEQGDVNHEKDDKGEKDDSKGESCVKEGSLSENSDFLPESPKPSNAAETTSVPETTRKRKSSDDEQPEIENGTGHKKAKLSKPTENGSKESSGSSIEDSSDSSENASSVTKDVPSSIKDQRSSLKGLLKITQTTASLCQNYCSKRIACLKDLDSYDSLIKEYSKLIKVVNCLNQNLTDTGNLAVVIRKELVEASNGNKNETESKK